MIRYNYPKLTNLVIKDDDPLQVSKLYQIERWYAIYQRIFEVFGKKAEETLGILVGKDEYWDKSFCCGSYGVKLKRRNLVEKLISPIPETFNIHIYEIACHCCLELYLRECFQDYKEELFWKGGRRYIRHEYLVKGLSRDPLMSFWAHYLGNHLEKLALLERHPFVYALERSMNIYRLEAVEYFWKKVESLPEDELNSSEKAKIFMDQALYATSSFCDQHPELLVFCLCQFNEAQILEYLKKDFAEHGSYQCLRKVLSIYRFDLGHNLLSFLSPTDISESEFYDILKEVDIFLYQGIFIVQGVKFVLCLWLREGFQKHRDFVFQNNNIEMLLKKDIFIMPFVRFRYMYALWAILDEVDPHLVSEFVSSSEAFMIIQFLQRRQDYVSLYKFLCYYIKPEDAQQA